MTTRVSLAELAAADIQLRPAEAVAIVSEICSQYTRGRLHGIPSPGVIRLTREGTVVAEGPTTTDQLEVRRAAHLLGDLLPDFEAPREYRASGGLRLVIARALGTLDLPPYETLQDFCEALGRFSVPDLATTVRSLFSAWELSQVSRRPGASSTALTISDIRRARRATGLSLDDLAAVSDVPAARLRELEWGYLRHWRADDDGRQQVARYARAAGLDEDVVLSIAWPMLLAWPAGVGDAAADDSSRAGVALVPAGPQAIAVVEPIAPRLRSSRVPALGLAVGSLALLTFATAGLYAGKPNRARTPDLQVPAVAEAIPQSSGPMVTPSTESEPDLPSRATEVQPRSVTPRPDADARTRPGPLPAAAGAALPGIESDSGRISAVSYVRPVPQTPRTGTQMRGAARPSRVSPSSSRKRAPAHRKSSFLHKELFRIVFR